MPNAGLAGCEFQDNFGLPLAALQTDLLVDRILLEDDVVARACSFKRILESRLRTDCRPLTADRRLLTADC